MLLQIPATALADSVAVHDAAVQLGTSLAGWIAEHLPGLPANVVGLFALAIGTGFGLLASKLWHVGNELVHASSTATGQQKFQDWWAVYGGWIGMLLSALVTGWTTRNWAAALLPVLAHAPAAAFGGVGSVLNNQNPKAVSAGRVGLLAAFLAGTTLLLTAPAPARASDMATLRAASSASALEADRVTGLSTTASVLSAVAPTPLPWLSHERFVVTAALGEQWDGVKATDHARPYGKLGVGYQWSAPLQANVGLQRVLGGDIPWRPWVEARFIWKL